MADPIDHASEGQAPGDAAFVRALKDRSEVLAIEPDRSLRTIGLLALIIAAGIGIWLRIALPPFGLATYSKPWPPGAPGAAGEGLGDRGIREGVDLFLLDKNPVPRHHPPKRAPSSPPILPVPRPPVNATRRDPAERPSHAKADGAKTRAAHSGSSTAIVITPATTHPNPEPAPNPEGDPALLRRADLLKKRGDYAGASATYRQVLARDPRNRDALAGMGDVYNYSGRYDSAARFYRAALAIAPRDANLHISLGTVLYFDSKRAAIPYFAKARNIQDPDRYLREQYDSAIAQYTEAITLDSGAVEALTDRGVLRDLHHEPEAAIQDYSLAIRLRPEYADAYSKRGETYKELGQYGAAVADFTAAIKLDSGSYKFDPTLHFANAYFGRGASFYKLGRLDQAIADFDSTLRLSPRHSLALISKGVALADQGRYDSAIAAYKRALSWLTPAEYDGVMLFAYLQLGNAWKAQGEYDSAIASYQKAMTSTKLAAKAGWRAAECFCHKRDAEDALVWLGKAKAARSADTRKWARDRELSLLWKLPEFQALIRD